MLKLLPRQNCRWNYENQYLQDAVTCELLFLPKIYTNRSHGRKTVIPWQKKSLGEPCLHHFYITAICDLPGEPRYPRQKENSGECIQHSTPENIENNHTCKYWERHHDRFDRETLSFCFEVSFVGVQDQRNKKQKKCSDPKQDPERDMMILNKYSGEAGQKTDGHRQKTSEMCFCMISAAGGLEGIKSKDKNDCG